MVVRCGEHMCWLFLWRTCTPTTSISFGRTCVSASSSRSLQSLLVLLLARRYRKSMFQVSGLLSELGHGLSPMWVQFQSMVWHKSNPCVLRIIPYHLQVTSFLSRSKWMGNPALKRTRWKMSCVHVATRVVQKTPLTEQAKFKSSKWHSTAPNKKATSPDIGQLSHEISRTVELRQNCIWSSITVEHGAWQERMICAWDMWKRGAIFMAKFQTSSTTQTAGKPLANPILRNFHHVPNSLSEYAGHSISNPACFGASCTVLCSVVFISFKVRLRRSVEELMNQQLDEVWKLRFPEKMWHFVVFFTIWSIWQRHVAAFRPLCR